MILKYLIYPLFLTFSFVSCTVAASEKLEKPLRNSKKDFVQHFTKQVNALEMLIKGQIISVGDIGESLGANQKIQLFKNNHPWSTHFNYRVNMYDPKQGKNILKPMIDSIEERMRTSPMYENKPLDSLTLRDLAFLYSNVEDMYQVQKKIMVMTLIESLLIGDYGLYTFDADRGPSDEEVKLILRALVASIHLDISLVRQILQDNSAKRTKNGDTAMGSFEWLKNQKNVSELHKHQDILHLITSYLGAIYSQNGGKNKLRKVLALVSFEYEYDYNNNIRTKQIIDAVDNLIQHDLISKKGTVFEDITWEPHP